MRLMMRLRGRARPTRAAGDGSRQEQGRGGTRACARLGLKEPSPAQRSWAPRALPEASVIEDDMTYGAREAVQTVTLAAPRRGGQLAFDFGARHRADALGRPLSRHCARMRAARATEARGWRLPRARRAGRLAP